MANFKSRVLKLESKMKNPVECEYVIVKRIVESDGKISGAMYKLPGSKLVNLNNKEFNNLKERKII